MHTRPASRSASLVLALVLVFGIAACGDDDGSVTAGPDTTTASPDTTPTASPTAPPEEPTAEEPSTEEPSAEEPSAGSPSAAALTEPYGCGFGFWAGSPDQSLGIFVQFEDFEAAAAGQVPAEGAVPSVIWSGRVDVGTDLFANWCDDVIESGEPTPVVDESWTIVDALIRIVGEPPVQASGTLTAELTDVVLESPDGERVEFGDLTLTNTAWGAFAG